MNASLIVLYGSQTGNAQDVAERIGREALLHLFAPRVMAMDSYDVTGLPTEQLVVFVAATAGQGDPPDNMRRFWRFLLRKSLPPDSLAASAFAVFGLGDSSYPQYNVMAKKLDRRLEGLGAKRLLERGLGDDQHPSGYEAALDPWLTQLWAALRATCPLPDGAHQPEPSEDKLLALGPPRYRITPLSSEEALAAAEAMALRLQAEQPHIAGLAEQVRRHHVRHRKKDVIPYDNGSGGGMEDVLQGTGGGGGLEAHRRLAEAAAAAADFRRLAMYVSGALISNPDSESALAGRTTAPSAAQRQEYGGCTSDIDGGGAATVMAAARPYGPWMPYLARLTANRRLTATQHFQDTRHLELDLGSSGLLYQPGDLVAILPMTSETAVDAFLQRLGLDGDEWVRVEAAEHPHHQHHQLHADPHQRTPPPVVMARVRSLVQGCLDIAGASPRRYFFQMLRQHVSTEIEHERLSYFATAEGRDDLYRYNQREGRTILEVLSDFRSAAPPLERILEAAPPLRPRHFSAASSAALRGPSVVHLLVALVSYTTPLRRPKRGLCSTYLAGLHPEAAEQEVRLAVWTEHGTLRLPKSTTIPLILVGPGTGVAPFRSFLEERYAQLLRLSQPPQSNPQPAEPGAAVPNGAAVHTTPTPERPTPAETTDTTATTTSPSAPAPCHLFFGCRSRTADFYYHEQWEELQRAGVLHPTLGLITAFSRDSREGQPPLGVTQLPEPLLPHVGANDVVTATGSQRDIITVATTTSAAAGGGGDGGGGGSGGGKVYVNHRIREHGKWVWRLLSQAGAEVYVSGSAKRMPEGVAAALTDVVAEHGGMDRTAAAAYVRQLELKGRYHVEAWS